jgi:hypothetical protein
METGELKRKRLLEEASEIEEKLEELAIEFEEEIPA